MPKYKVSIARNAKKQLERIPQEYVVKILIAISDLKSDPRPSGCVKLSGYDYLYRIRIGVYRVIYSVDDGIRVIEVRRVFHHNDGY